MDVSIFKSMKEFLEFDDFQLTAEDIKALEKLHPEWFYEDAREYALDGDNTQIMVYENSVLMPSKLKKE